MEERFGSDLPSRVIRFAEAAGPLGISVVGLLLVLLVYLVVMRMSTPH